MLNKYVSTVYTSCQCVGGVTKQPDGSFRSCVPQLACVCVCVSVTHTHTHTGSSVNLKMIKSVTHQRFITVILKRLMCRFQNSTPWWILQTLLKDNAEPVPFAQSRNLCVLLGLIMFQTLALFEITSEKLACESCPWCVPGLETGFLNQLAAIKAWADLCASIGVTDFALFVRKTLHRLRFLLMLCPNQTPRQDICAKRRFDRPSVSFWNFLMEAGRWMNSLFRKMEINLRGIISTRLPCV